MCIISKSLLENSEEKDKWPANHLIKHIRYRIYLGLLLNLNKRGGDGHRDFRVVSFHTWHTKDCFLLHTKKFIFEIRIR